MLGYSTVADHRPIWLGFNACYRLPFMAYRDRVATSRLCVRALITMEIEWVAGSLKAGNFDEQLKSV